MKENKFYECNNYKTIIRMIADEDIPVVCNGQQMREMIPNVDDGSKEKHVPQLEFINNVLKVKIGSVNHPMEEKHSIKWVYMISRDGEQLKYLKKNGAPEVDFALTNGDHPVKVYAFCNLHGLWKAEL